LRELSIEDLSDNVEGAAFHGEEAELSEQALAIDQSASELIGQVDGTVKCLIKLIPNLCDPFPGDLYSQTGSQSDAYPDIDLARGLFPSATPALISRLGKANWKRRQYLKMLQEKGKPGMPFARKGLHFEKSLLTLSIFRNQLSNSVPSKRRVPFKLTFVQTQPPVFLASLKNL
jgi:hypothetical protein